MVHYGTHNRDVLSQSPVAAVYYVHRASVSQIFHNIQLIATCYATLIPNVLIIKGE